MMTFVLADLLSPFFSLDFSRARQMRQVLERTSLCFLISCLVGTIAYSGDGQSNSFVRVETVLARTDLEAGGSGSMLISFTPVDGIHITAEPPVTVRVERNRLVSLKRGPNIRIDKESKFLSTSQPVEQQFIVSKKAKPGEYSVEGTITYYFCSDAEGWCRKASQPVTLKLTIRKL